MDVSLGAGGPLLGPPGPASGPRAAVLAVVGVSGGCGTSTLAAATAVAAATEGWRTVLVDLQAGGGGVDVLLGLDHLAGLRWPDLVEVDGAVDGPALLERLPRLDPPRRSGGRAVPVLSHARDGLPVPGRTAVAGVLAGVRCVDLVVLDLARGLACSSLLSRAGVDGAALVAGCGLSALTALTETAAQVGPVVAETGVVLRGARAQRIADDVVAALDLPVLACLPDDPAVARDLESGRAPGRNGRLAEVGRLLARGALETVRLARPGLVS